MPDHIAEFLAFSKHMKDEGRGVLINPSMIRAAAKELRRLRADAQRWAEYARMNGRKGGRPRAPEAAIKPASARRRELRAKLKFKKAKEGD